MLILVLFAQRAQSLLQVDNLLALRVPQVNTLQTAAALLAATALAGNTVITRVRTTASTAFLASSPLKTPAMGFTNLARYVVREISAPLLLPSALPAPPARTQLPHLPP